MNACRTMVIVALAAGAVACAAPPAPAPAPAPTASAKASAHTGILSGKIVWVDLKTSTLLLECQDQEGCKSVKGKGGETHASVIPASLKGAAGSWKEGSMVKVTFEDLPDGGRVLKTVDVVK